MQKKFKTNVSLPEEPNYLEQLEERDRSPESIHDRKRKFRIKRDFGQIDLEDPDSKLVKVVKNSFVELADLSYERIQDTYSYEKVFKIPTQSKFGGLKRKSKLGSKLSGLVVDQCESQATIIVEG